MEGRNLIMGGKDIYSFLGIEFVNNGSLDSHVRT